MKVFERKNNFSCVKFSPFFGKSTSKLEMVKKLPSVDELHYKIEMKLVLESELKFHNEWVVKLF